MSRDIERAVIWADGEREATAALAFGGRCVGDHEESRLWIYHEVEGLGEVHRELLYPYAALGEDDRGFEQAVLGAGKRLVMERLGLDGWRGPAIQEVVVRGRGQGGWRAFLEDQAVDLAVITDPHRRALEEGRVPVAVVRGYETEPRVERVLIVLEVEADEARDREVMDVGLEMARRWGATVEVLGVVHAPSVQRSSMVRRVLPVDRQGLQEQLAGAVQGRWEALVEAMGIGDVAGVPEKIAVAVGDGASVVGEQAAAVGADLVVVGRGEARRGSALGMSRMSAAIVDEVGRHLVVVPPRHRSTPLGQWRGDSGGR